jgi:hypothetical protein
MLPTAAAGGVNQPRLRSAVHWPGGSGGIRPLPGARQSEGAWGSYTWGSVPPVLSLVVPVPVRVHVSKLLQLQTLPPCCHTLILKHMESCA